MLLRMTVLTGLLAIVPAVASAQPAEQGALEPTAQSIPVVVTSGEGVVRRAPDRAWVTIAAESRGRTAQEAQRANADAMGAVNAKLKSLGIAADALQTTGFNLQIEYDYTNGRQVPRDYVARNQVQVRVDDLSKVGDAIGAAVGSGATSVSGLRFDLQNREEVERDALRRAVADAKARADAAAAGAGVRVDHIVRIEEQREFSVVPRPSTVMMEARVAAPAPPVPVEAGEIEVRSHVTITAAIK